MYQFFSANRSPRNYLPKSRFKGGTWNVQLLTLTADPSQKAKHPWPEGNGASSVSIVIVDPSGSVDSLSSAWSHLLSIRLSRRQTTTCIPSPSRQMRNRGYPVRGGRAERRRTRCVRSPPCPIHPHALTARNDARGGKERDSSRRTPLNQYSTSSAATANILAILSGPRARQFRRAE